MPHKSMQPQPGLYLEPQRGTGPSYFQNTFSALSFITIGDKYGHRPPLKGTRMSGKQFSTTFPKRGEVADAYFTKEFRVLGGPYAATQPQRYLETQPRDKRKKGFLSGDASKRDESMNSTMSAILAATYKKEEIALSQAQEKAKAEYLQRGFKLPDSVLPSRPHTVAGVHASLMKVLSNERSTKKDPHGLKRTKKEKEEFQQTYKDLYQEGVSGPEFLFDIGRMADTTFSSGSKSTKWFEPRLYACRTSWSQGDKVMQGVEKRLGSNALSCVSYDIGQGARELQERTMRTKVPVEYEASPHSRRSVLQQQLNRNCGALLPPFSSTCISAAGPPGSTLLL